MEIMTSAHSDLHSNLTSVHTALELGEAQHPQHGAAEALALG